MVPRCKKLAHVEGLGVVIHQPYCMLSLTFCGGFSLYDSIRLLL